MNYTRNYVSNMEILKIADVFSNLPDISTARLLLRKLKLEDAKDMFEYASDPEVTKDLAWPTHSSIDNAQTFIKKVLSKYADNDVSEWGVTLKDSGKLIGTCGFLWWRPEHAKAEIGYAISRQYWGRGLMTEAVGAVMNFAFSRMKLHRLEAQCTDTNIASEKVLIKCGMKFEGIHRDVVYEKGGFRSLKSYAILADEFLMDRI